MSAQDVKLQDLEAQTPVEEPLAETDDGGGEDAPRAAADGKDREAKGEAKKTPNLVAWDGPNDPLNPRNWPLGEKWSATIIVSIFAFMTPISSSMVAPALPAISRSMHITSPVLENLTVSFFVLGYAFGPMLFGPLSEVYGRVPILQVANLVYLVFNVACALARSQTQLLVFRFLSGFGGAAPLALGNGVLGDCWSPADRAKSVAIYTLAPLLGPAIGPIMGGFVAQYSSWRWVFWATSIADGAVQAAGLVWLRESWAPAVLRQKCRRLRKETGNEALYTVHDNIRLADHLARALVRPFRLLLTQPIVQVLSVYMAYLFGIMYLLLTSFPRLWTGVYGEAAGVGGLNYISLGLGLCFGTQLTARANTILYRRYTAGGTKPGAPWMRLPMLFPGAALAPVGLLVYGWSARFHTHWIVPNVGAFLFITGAIMTFGCIRLYLVDAYSTYAASAIAAAFFLRSMAAFGFPLFAPDMYANLGYGWGDTVLALVAVVVGWPAPVLLWWYGERLRGMSKYAAGGD